MARLLVKNADYIITMNKGRKVVSPETSYMIFLDTNRLEYAGAHLDPVSMLLLCHPTNADMSIINGEIVVEDGVIKNIDLESVLEKHKCCSANLIQRAEKKTGKIYTSVSWARAFD
jgi:hypothetical protein